MSDESKSYTLQTASFDARFPNQNQTKHWYVSFLPLAFSVPHQTNPRPPSLSLAAGKSMSHPTRFGSDRTVVALLLTRSVLSPSRNSYVDYFRCVNAKGEDFVPCKQFARAYHSLCPSES